MQNEDLFKKYASNYRLMVNQGSTPAEALAKCMADIENDAKAEEEKLNQEKINEQNLKALEDAVNKKFQLKANEKKTEEKSDDETDERLREDFEKFLKAFGFRDWQLPRGFRYHWLLY